MEREVTSEREFLVRAPHLALAWIKDKLVVTEAREGRKCVISPELTRALHVANEPITAEELAQNAGVSERVIEQLVSKDLLVPSAQAPTEGHWSTFELAVQRMSGKGGKRKATRGDMPSVRKPRQTTSISLPKSGQTPQMELAEALHRRRSRRQFASKRLALDVLGDLLHFSAGLQDANEESGYSFRPYPSGGGRHPLEIYVLAINVEGLDSGAYRFDAFSECLYKVRGEDGRIKEIYEELDVYTGGLSGQPAAILLVTAVFARTMWKYADMGLALVYKDVGGLFQTLYLVSTALGLAGVAVGGGPEALNARWLGLDPMEESQVGCFVVGEMD